MRIAACWYAKSAMLRHAAESLKAGIMHRRKIVGGILMLLLSGVLLSVTLFAVLSGHLCEREREKEVMNACIRIVGLVVRSQDLPPVFLAGSSRLWIADGYDVKRGVGNLCHY